MTEHIFKAGSNYKINFNCVISLNGPCYPNIFTHLSIYLNFSASPRKYKAVKINLKY